MWPAEGTMRRRSTQLLAVALAAVLVLQSTVAGVALAQQSSERPVSPADEIYVQDDGDAILVYDSASSVGGPNRTEFGVDVAENVAYALVTDTVEGTPSVEGALAMTANRSAIWADGNLSLPRPEPLQSFTLDASGVTTDETARSDLSAAATVTDESGMSQAVDAASTEGTITITANQVTASGTFDVDTVIPLPERSQQLHNYSIRETESGYVLDVEQRQSVDARFVDTYRNRTRQKQLLKAQYGMLVGDAGSVGVEFDRLDVTENGEQARLDHAYTVRVAGVEDRGGELLRQALAESPRISTAQADELVAALKTVEINRLQVEYSVTEDGAAGSFHVDVDEYGPLAMAYFDILGSMEDRSALGVDVERMEKRFEAQRAANLEQYLNWSGSLSHPDSESVAAELEFHATNDNWAAYVDELDARDIPHLTSRYDIEGAIEDDRLSFQGNASVSGDQLYRELLRSLPSQGTPGTGPTGSGLSALFGAPGQGELSEEAAALVRGLRDSRPRTAKMVARYDSDGVRFEAGAAFGNLSALRDALVEQTGSPMVTSVVGREDSQGGGTYVRVSNAVGGDATESDVRALAAVDAGTTIHMPGEGDRDFPSMDVDRARNFLGLGETSGGIGPGFGPIAGLVAILGAAFVLRRRH